MSLLTAAPRLRNTSVFPRPVERSVLRKEYPLSIVAAARFIVLALFNPFSSSLYLSRVDGIALLAVFTWFLISTIRKGKRETPAEETPADGTGNVIGSNIFNLLFVLGALVTINPIKTEWISVYDAAILVAVSLFAMIPALQKKEIRRVWGILFILLYAAYTAYLLIR